VRLHLLRRHRNPRRPLRVRQSGGQPGRYGEAEHLPTPPPVVRALMNRFYDTSGHVVAKAISGDWICSSYDARDRPAQITYPATPTVGARTVTCNHAVGSEYARACSGPRSRARREAEGVADGRTIETSTPWDIYFWTNLGQCSVSSGVGRNVPFAAN
jgi:hypothetical protein